MAGARAAGMDRARDDLLPDPTLARDQDLRVRACNAVDLLFEGGDFGAAAGQLDVRPWPYRADWADPRACFQRHHQSLFMNRSMSCRCSSDIPTNVAPIAIPRPWIRSRGDPANLNVSQERCPREREAQAAA